MTGLNIHIQAPTVVFVITAVITLLADIVMCSMFVYLYSYQCFCGQLWCTYNSHHNSYCLVRTSLLSILPPKLLILQEQLIKELLPLDLQRSVLLQ